MNIIKLTKKSNALFFAALLLVGTIAASSPLFMLGAQAEPYYGMDKDRKVVSVSSLKCNNINVNVNGLELEVLPPSLSTLLTGGEADDNAYSYGSGERNYGSASSSSDNDFRFICINNNNNMVIEEEQIPPTPPTPPTPPEPTTASLTVTKTTTCDLPNRPDLCIEDFLFTVTGTDPVPSSFSETDTPVVVTLGAGSFSVKEEGDYQELNCISRGYDGGQESDEEDTYICTNYEGACEGNIGLGEELTCNIENTFIDTTRQGATLNVIEEEDAALTVASSPIIAQGTQDSHGLTALEKQPSHPN